MIWRFSTEHLFGFTDMRAPECDYLILGGTDLCNQQDLLVSVSGDTITTHSYRFRVAKMLDITEH